MIGTGTTWREHLTLGVLGFILMCDHEARAAWRRWRARRVLQKAQAASAAARKF
jgi:hypothetical protein